MADQDPITEPKKTRTSVSRIDTFEQCARYDYFQVVEKIKTPDSPFKDAGTAIHEIVESQFSPEPTSRKAAYGAAARALQYYPLPGQYPQEWRDYIQTFGEDITNEYRIEKWHEWVKANPSVAVIEVERKFDAAPYAGALLYAKIDCYVPPGDFRWGNMVRPPKRGLARISDLKTAASRNVRYKENSSLLDTNRQLLAYVRIRRPEDKLVEVAQVVVGREAPHTSCSPIRIIGQQMAIDQEGADVDIIKSMVASRKAPSALDLPAANIATCERWYGKRCDFYGRCRGGNLVTVGVRPWGDILTASDQDGRGGEGTRAALELAVRDSSIPRHATLAEHPEWRRTLADILTTSDNEPQPYEKLSDDPFWGSQPVIHEGGVVSVNYDADGNVASRSVESADRVARNVPGVSINDWIASLAFNSVVKSGRIGSFSGVFRFLSNFYLSDIPVVDFVYSTVEHAYQAAKCVNLDDVERVRSCPTASGAKRIGRQVVLRKDWEQVKIGIMLSLVGQKFQDPDLRRRLLATGTAELVEGNSWADQFWGVDEKTGRGRNEMGKILMKVRKELLIMSLSTNVLSGVESYTEIELEKHIMSLVNPPDANQNHTNAALVVEGPIQVLSDTLQGKPYCNVVGTRHGKCWELRILLDACKFLVGGERYEFTQPSGKVIQKVRGADTQLSPVLSGSSPTASFAGICSVNGKQDIDLIRRNVLHPLLRAWDKLEPDRTVTSPGSGDKDAIEQIEAQQKESSSGGSGWLGTASEIEKLKSAVGCTESQAERMVGSGITDARFRAGDVKQSELEALPKFGAQRAAGMLERYAAVRAKSQTAQPFGQEPFSEGASEHKTAVDVTLESGSPSNDLMLLRETLRELEMVALERNEEIVILRAHLRSHDAGVPAGYALYVDCLPVQGVQCVTLEAVLLPYLNKVARDRNVVDVQLLGVLEWPGYLMAEIFANPPPFGAIAVRSKTKEWDVVRRFFLDRSSVVVHGM